MITTPEQYKEQLWLIQNENFPKKVILPHAEKIYNIDYKTRIVESPEFLSVLKDHKSENIYFSIKRYVDYIDLAETACIIQYEISDGSTGIYPVPFYDLISLNEKGNERILFPWLIDGQATAISGPVKYAIRFYRLDRNGDHFVYSFNTLESTSKVLYGMDVQSEDLEGKFDVAPSAYDDLVARVSALAQQDMYWIQMK